MLHSTYNLSYKSGCCTSHCILPFQGNATCIVSSYTCISLHVHMSNSSRSRIALLHINDIVPVLLESQKCVCWGCVCCCYTYKNVSAAHTILNEPISLSLQKEKKAGLLPGSDAIYSCYSKFLKI